MTPSRPSLDRPGGSPVLLVLGLLAVALLARLPSLGDGLWYDELAAWADYASRGPVHVLTMYHDPANHVLQSLLTWASVEALGEMIDPSVAMRLPSLLASLVAVVLVALLPRAALGGRPEAPRVLVLAATLAAVCPVLAIAGTEARGYAFMIAGAAGSTAAWIAWMTGGPGDGGRGRRRPALLAGYAGAMLLGTWAHPVTAVVAAGHAAASLGLAATVAARERRRRALAGLLPVAVAAAACLLAYAPLLDDIVRLRGTALLGGASEGPQPRPLGPEGRHAILQLGGAWSDWALPGLALLVAGVVRLLVLARRGHERAGLLLWAWLSGGLVAVAAIGLLGTWMYARFLLFLVPGALAAMAVGLAWLMERRTLAGRLALVAVLAGWTADLVQRGPRQPIREAAALVLERAEPGDAVHAIGLRQRVSQAYLGQMPYSWSGEHGRRLDAELPAPPPRWILMLYPQLVTPATLQRLDELGYRRTARFRGWIDWGGGDVEVWERR